jgi:hypothetical protein
MIKYCYVLGVCVCVCVCERETDYRQNMEWILDLLTQLGTTNNSRTIVDLHTLQITVANSKSFPASIVFSRCFLVTDINSGDLSASHPQILPVWQISHSWTFSVPSSTIVSCLFSLPCRAELSVEWFAPVVFLITTLHGLTENTVSSNCFVVVDTCLSIHYVETGCITIVLLSCACM